MMVRLRNGNHEVEVQDFVVRLYKRNGYEEVAETKTEEPKVSPKRTTTRKTKKTQ